MGWDTVLRSGMATADVITKSLQAPVWWYAWTSSDQFGKPVYAPPVELMAVVEFKQRRIRQLNGSEILQQAVLTIIQPIEPNYADERREVIDQRDQFTLPNGHTGNVLEVNGVTDPLTGHPYVLTVSLG